MRRFSSLCAVGLLAATVALAQPANSIWTARWVVTMDGARRVIENGAVAVLGSRIIAVGPRAEIEKKHPAQVRLDRGDAIIAPGLINTHTHAPMSLFRGIADDLRLQEWLEKFIFPAEAKNVSPEFVRWGTKLACLEMLLSGTTTFTDMYYFEDVIAETAREAGMRGVLGQTVIGFPVADYKTPADALAGTERFFVRFKDDDLITPAVAPHAVYTNSDETLRAARALAAKYNRPLLIHLSETKRENEEIQSKRAMSPTRVLDSLGVWNGRSLAAHGVWLDDQDLKILRDRGVGVAHCPSSNMKLSSGAAPVVKMLSLGLAVGLGTDGVAGSNNDHNLMEEMDLAAKLQKLVTMDPTVLRADEVVAMATIGGARALGLEKEIGSIEPGKRADLITLRLSRAHVWPMYGVYSQIVYALKGSDVQDVMVNGRTLVRDGQPLTIKASEVRAKAREWERRIRASVGMK